MSTIETSIDRGTKRKEHTIPKTTKEGKSASAIMPKAHEAKKTNGNITP